MESQSKTPFLFKKLIALFALYVFFGAQLQAQTIDISGKVTSSEDGVAMPGVSVVAQGTTIGVITNFEGEYFLTVPADVTKLIFSFVGMKTQEVDIENRTRIDVTLETDVLGLDEVIVTAYGTSKKGAFTGSAEQINSDDFDLRPISNISTAMEGKAAGVFVTAPQGQPGSSQSIRVRGFGSYSASSSPLYVVDGVPFSGTLNTINPADIESMTVLKDASSTALYGNKAANGVVLITTKKGRAGQGRLTVDVSAGITSRAQQEYERLDAFEYYPIMWEAYRNSLAIPGIDDPADVDAANQQASDNIAGFLGYNPFNVADDQIVLNDGSMNPSAQFKGAYGEDRDWLGGITQQGQRQNYNVNYSGASEKVDYYISVGHLNEKGWIIESDFKRYTGRANVNIQATDWFRTGVSIGATQSNGNMAQTGGSSSYVNPIRFTRQMGPIYPIHLLDPVTGEYVLDDDGNKQYDINDNRTSNSSTGRHVIAEIKWDEDLEERTQLMAKTYGEVTFLKDFKFTANFSYDQNYYYNSYFNNKFVGDGAPGGRAYRTSTRRNSANFNQLLNYVKSFGGHNLNILAGHESYSLRFNSLSGGKSEIIADGNTELGNFVTTLDLDSYEDNYTTEGYFARIDYNFNNRFYITGSYRRDGSSKFHVDNRWGDFYSVGAAWRLEQESFIQGASWIDLLKLRGSYGQVGNDAGIDFYAYQALYGLGWNNQTASGIYQDKLMAAALQWESNNSFDIAVEFGFLNRIFGTLEFYHRISDNLLFEVPLPLSGGIDDQNQNIGTLFNQGIELSISVDIIKTSDFEWNLNANFSTLKNEFTELPQEEIIDGSKKLMVGHSRYDYWLKEFMGVNPDDGSPLYRADVYSDTDTDILIQGSDTLTTDQNNARYGYFDTAIPDLYGAFTNSLTYKGFSLNFMFTYQVGGKVIDYNYRSIMSSGDYGASKGIDILNRWQQPGDVTDIPRMDVTNTSNTEATSTRWLTDASFINLRQLTLSYNFSQKVTGAWSKGLRIYVSGENLFLKSARKGMNVQQNFSGTTSNVYTPSRIFTIGANLTL
jgi:TonB-linked SusC/RagA family outer membrane protein